MNEDVLNDLYTTTRRVLEEMVRDFLHNQSYRYVRQVVDLVGLTTPTVRNHVRVLTEQWLLTEKPRESGNGYEYRPSVKALALYLARERRENRETEALLHAQKEQLQAEVSRLLPVPVIPLPQEAQEGPLEAPDEPPAPSGGQGSPEPSEGQEGPLEAQYEPEEHRCPVCAGRGELFGAPEGRYRDCEGCEGSGVIRCVRVV